MKLAVRLVVDRWLATQIAVLCLAACASSDVDRFPSEYRYEAPSQAVDAGSIVGSQIKQVIWPDATAWIRSVDRQRVMVGRDGWNTPLRLPSGMRRLGLMVRTGGFVAEGTVDLNVVAGQSYRLRFSSSIIPVTILTPLGGPYECDYWVEEATTGSVVTKPGRAQFHLQ